MKAFTILFSLLVLISSAVNCLKSYKNHKVVSFRIETEKQLGEVQLLESQLGVKKI